MNYEEDMLLTGLTVDPRPVEVGVAYAHVLGGSVTVLDVESGYVLYQSHDDSPPISCTDRVFRTLYRRVT